MNVNSTNYDKIFQDVKEINTNVYKFKNNKAFIGMTSEQFKEEMKQKYNDLYTSFNFIFNRAVSGNLDTNMFSFMISKAKLVQKNTLSNFDASKQVGEKLVNTFVKPTLDESKN